MKDEDKIKDQLISDLKKRIAELEGQKTDKGQNENMADSEQRLRLVFEATNDGYWDWNPMTGETFFSPRYYTMLGYEPDEFPHVYESWRSRAHPDDVERIEKVVQKALENYSSFSAEFRMKAKNGSWQWLLTRGKAVEQDNVGRSVRMVGAHTDITERKKAEDALQKSNFFLNRSQEAGKIGSFVLDIPNNDPKAHTWESTSEMDRIFGIDSTYPRTGESWLSLIVQREEVLEYFNQQVFDTKSNYIKEYQIVRPSDGEVRWIFGHGELEFDDQGNCIRMIGTVQDITDRKQAEEALQQSKAQLASLGDNIPGGMTYQVETDRSGKTRKFLYVSAGVIKMHEITADAVLKNPELIYGQIAEDQQSLFLEKEIEALKEMKNFSVEACFKLPSGRTRWGMLSSAPRLSPNGNILWDGIEIDITDRKKAEKDRERLQERLRKAQRMESIATLAGGIAHQFNNALTIVTGNIELLEMDAPDGNNTDGYINDIKTSASRMTQLTAQLLTYARGGKYQAQKISLSDFVRDTLPSTGHTTDPALHIETCLADDIFHIEADLTQMQMVLSVLLMNSVEAMDGKGRIQIDCRNETVTEQIAEGFPGLRPGKYACMTITDYGRGMDKETRDRAFEPFFTTKFPGRGLGLAGVYGFVKSHDGYIMVDSELGKRTTVKIYLPACESPDKEESTPNRID